MPDFEHGDVAQMLLVMNQNVPIADHARYLVDRDAWAVRDLNTMLWLSDVDRLCGAKQRLRNWIRQGLNQISQSEKQAHAANGGASMALLRRLGQFGNVNFVEGVVSWFERNFTELSTITEMWDAVACDFQHPEGVFDLVSGQNRVSNLDDLNMHCAGVVPRDVPTPLWDQKVLEMVAGDVEMKEYLLDHVALCTLGEPTETVLAVVGGGGTGKSVFMNVLLHVLGTHAVVTKPEVWAARDRHFDDYQMAWLPGTRACFFTEPEQGAVLNEARIKALTGRELMTARMIYGKPVQFRPVATLVGVMNDMPIIARGGSPMVRRLRPVTMDAPPVTPDNTLTDRLKAEGEGILFGLLMRAHAYIARGRVLDAPARVVAQAADEWASGTSGVAVWVDEELEPTSDEDDFVPTQEMLHRYRAFAMDRGFTAPMSEPQHVTRFVLEVKQALNQRTHGMYQTTVTKKIKGTQFRGLSKLRLKVATTTPPSDTSGDMPF